MQATQSGDQVLVHYVKRFDDGLEVSSRSRGREPLELTVGTAHPRLPGLGAKLVGLTPGQSVTVFVPADQAHGLRDPDRLRRLARTRFPTGRPLVAGKRIHVTDRNGRSRSVRVVRVLDATVVVDLNHPRAGQGVEMSVELVTILAPNRGTGVAAS